MGPFVSITEPSTSWIKAGKEVEIYVLSMDKSGTQTVDISINGTVVCREKDRPYQCWWTAPSQVGSAHQITAVARDSVGNSRTSTVRLTVVS